MQVRWDAYVAAGMPALDTIDDLVPFLQALQDAVPVNANGEKVYAFGGFPDWETCVMKFTWDLMTWYGYAEQDYLGVNWGTGDIVNRWKKAACTKRCSPSTTSSTGPDCSILKASASQNFDTYSIRWTRAAICWACGAGRCRATTPTNAWPGRRLCNHDPGRRGPHRCGHGALRLQPCVDPRRQLRLSERVLEIIDWLCTTEGIMTTWNGRRDCAGIMTKTASPTAPISAGKLERRADTEMPAEYGGGTYYDGKSALNNSPS